MARTKQWTMRTGRKIRVCNMDDRHLVNTIRLLERRWAAEQLAFCALPEPNGDMAQLAFEQEVDQVLDMTPGDVWPIYDDMVAEAADRGLRL